MDIEERKFRYKLIEIILFIIIFIELSPQFLMTIWEFPKRHL